MKILDDFFDRLEARQSGADYSLADQMDDLLCWSAWVMVAGLGFMVFIEFVTCRG